MNTKICTVSVSLLAGACALAFPAAALAGNVGYFGNCAGQEGNPSTAITAAGHTPIAVAVLDAPSLANLDALVIESCSVLPANPALDNAISNGMKLFYDVIMINSTPPPIAGLGGLIITPVNCGQDVEPAAGSPVTTGPGGTITSSNLDGTFLCSYRASSTSLPAGAKPFLTGASATDVVSFGYNIGQTKVAYSMSQFFAALPGGVYAGDTLAPGTMIYYTNVVNWLFAPSTTCASEGYKGAQLTWCKNICENGLTGQVLDTWIHRWINRYRDLPYCAVETPSNPA